MQVKSITGMISMREYDYTGKTVLLRIDINSPVDQVTKKIVNTNRINMSIPTINYLLNQGAKLALIAHQGDTLDYQNLIPMREHAQKLSELLNTEVRYIDDVAGPAAQEAVKKLKVGEAVLLGNLRYLSEEISTFEDAVKLEPEEMLNTYLVKNLAPIVDFYINDAFAAAHRNSPSMVAFQQVLPSAAGDLLMKEVETLTKIRECPEKPSVFVLGGAKISDAFGMMKQVLQNGTADKILTSGITGHVMLLAKGISIGEKSERFIKDRSLHTFIEPAKEYLQEYSEKIVVPIDLAYSKDDRRVEVSVNSLPLDELYMDIGTKTISFYKDILATAGTIFVNGPAGIYENKLFEKGTKEIWKAIAEADGYSVIGGGDSVSAAVQFIDTSKIDYICTAGGAMVRFLSGRKLPLIEAMKNAAQRGKVVVR